MRKLLGLLLHRSGTVAFLRQQWRHDDTASSRQLEHLVETRVKTAVNAVRHDSETALATVETTVKELRARLRASEHELNKLREALAADATHYHSKYAAALDLQQITAHVARAVAAAPVRQDPMPHLVVSGLLPPSTYDALLDAIPSKIFFQEDRDGRKLDLKLNDHDFVPTWTRQMWSFMRDVVIPGTILPAVQQRLQPFIAEEHARRFGDERGALVARLRHTAPGGRLMLRRPGYSLAPHLDPIRAVATCLLYLARPGDDVRFGTQLFRVNALPDIDRTNTYYPDQHGYASELVTTVPFTPNTLVAFVNGGQAAHGVQIPETAPAGTERYAYQFYVSPDPELLKDALGATTVSA